MMVLGAGLLAGTLDILYACVFWALRARIGPGRIFQSVAAGLLGPAAYEGGTGTALLGLALHFFIATMMAMAYWAAARRWSLLRRRSVLCGAVYGLLLYGFMNHVVVPLSAAAAGPDDALWIGMTVAAHVLLVGIPIALLCSRAAQRAGTVPA